MNKKLIFEGGEPDINFDDILRDPIANKAALTAIVRGLASSSGPFSIYNASVYVANGDNAEAEAGYVMISGEILQVDAHETARTVGTDVYEYQKVTTFDTRGDKTFNDSSSQQTWAKYRAVLVNVASSSNPADELSTLRSLVSPLRTKVVGIGDWNMYTTGGGSGVSTILINHGIADYKKIRRVSGIIVNDADTNMWTIGFKNITTLAPQTGVGIITSTQIQLASLTGGLFDVSAYSSPPSSNRGFLTIEYIL